MYKITHNKDVYPEDILEKALKGIAKKESDKKAVSYTHLTLPTNREV